MWIPLILISCVFYAWTNILDSLLVKHYENHPMVLLWTQSIFSLVTLVALAIFMDFSTSWAMFFVIAGFLGYVGDYFFFRALECTDVSVVNLAWAILTVFIAVGSFIFFGEFWNMYQWIGAVLVLGGMIFLSVIHQHITVRAISLLVLIALFYTPFYIGQKAAFIQGAQVFPVLFWMFLGRESCCFLVPLAVPSIRSRILSLPQRVDALYFLLAALVIALFFSAIYLGALAYDAGLASLVAVVSNVQMFMVMFFAWLLWRVLPQYASREILSRQLVQIKLLSFAIVFVGLAFLALA